jgi:hypothetical protein
MKVSALTGLENLDITEKECPFPLAPEFYRIITSLSLLTHWTEACPSLKRVSVFGEVFER